MCFSIVFRSLLELLEPKLSTFGPTWELLGPTWGQLERMLGGSGPTWAVLAAPGRQVGAGRQVDLGQLGARWELDGQGDRSYGFFHRKSGQGIGKNGPSLPELQCKFIYRYF